MLLSLAIVAESYSKDTIFFAASVRAPGTHWWPKGLGSHLGLLQGYRWTKAFGEKYELLVFLSVFSSPQGSTKMARFTFGLDCTVFHRYLSRIGSFFDLKLLRFTHWYLVKFYQPNSFIRSYSKKHRGCGFMKKTASKCSVSSSFFRFSSPFGPFWYSAEFLIVWILIPLQLYLSSFSIPLDVQFLYVTSKPAIICDTSWPM